MAIPLQRISNALAKLPAASLGRLSFTWPHDSALARAGAGRPDPVFPFCAAGGRARRPSLAAMHAGIAAAIANAFGQCTDRDHRGVAAAFRRAFAVDQRAEGVGNYLRQDSSSRSISSRRSATCRAMGDALARDRSKLRVGLVWSGSSSFAANARRSIPLASCCLWRRCPASSGIVSSLESRPGRSIYRQRICDGGPFQ